MMDPKDAPKNARLRLEPAAPGLGKVYAVRAVVPDDAAAELDRTMRRLVESDPGAAAVLDRWVAGGGSLAGGAEGSRGEGR